MTDTLSHDYETRSEVDLTKAGLDNYARHESTEVLMCSWAINDGPVELWVPAEGEPMPKMLREAMQSPDVRKRAHNAPFERAITTHVLGIARPIEEYFCTMVHGHTLSLPGQLKEVGPILGLPEDMLKHDGKALITTFCMPMPQPAMPKPGSKTYASQMKKHLAWTPGTFRDFRDKRYAEKWEKFKSYCVNDTVAEREIARRLSKWPIPDHEMQLWYLDQKINQTGLPINMRLVSNAIDIMEAEVDRLIVRLQELTGLDNPLSTPQFGAWVRGQGYPFQSLGKGWVPRALRDHGDEISELGKTCIALRNAAAKASVKKLYVLRDATSEHDARHRNVFQFAGASRTWRWAGRSLQPQNLSKPPKDLEGCIPEMTHAVETGDADLVRMLFGENRTMDVLSSIIRPCVQAPPGKKLVVCDLSAIEYVVLAWLTRDKEMLKVLENGLDPYKAFGVHMFGKPYEQITKAERNICKPGTLGGGYMLSGGEERENKHGEVIKTGLWAYAESMGIEMQREQAHLSIEVYRSTHMQVKQSWYDLMDAAIHCASTRESVSCYRVKFAMSGPLMQIHLPSGRALSYIRPKVESKYVEKLRKNKPQLTYEGQNQVTKQWERVSTHGGKIVENLVQAIARDVLKAGLIAADADGFEVIGHVHDEILTLLDEDDPRDHRDLERLMTQKLDWAPDMILKAAGYTGKLYVKD